MKRRIFKKKPVDSTSKLVKPTIFKITIEYKANILLHAYLGKKGYTIPKAVLDPVDLIEIKETLLLKPIIPGPQFGAQQEPAFPVYRENTAKIYIPRFFGIERYGLPNTSEIAEGETIDVPFVKELRDYQNKIIDIYLDHSKSPIVQGSTLMGNGAILEVPCGRGKCLGKDTPILMFDGSIKMVQDIVVGDLLMGDDSTPRTILTLARGKETMYKVNTKHGEGYIVNESHILSLKYRSKDDVLDISVLDYLNFSNSYHEDNDPLLGYRVPILFDEVPLEIDPYLFGYWLGDEDLSLSLENINILMDFIRNNNMFNNIYIPHHYKCNSRKKQLALLAGIIDADGYYHDGFYEITLQNQSLFDDIIFIARSLGFAAYKNQEYTITICGVGLEEIPVKCYRNRIQKIELCHDVLKYVISLEKMDVDDYYGFEIDGNRRFVLGDFTVTHNTVMALKIISEIKKKTLILVHKEFLMNQWIERIAEFLPSARIGKIQGTVQDIEGKDIVIGMIQTMYNREFDSDFFSPFGLTIIDEVHRIGSEEFSKTLFKTITPNMLGISATVERKDKLTKLLYMFIGPKIYSEDRKDDDLVQVRGIEFQSPDPAYSTMEYDFRGMPKYSTMITKICEFGHRSDFIVRVVDDLLKENPENQIMVLAHNRSLLSYLFDAIEHKIGEERGSVGFYVGGMKEKDLKITEGKRIVLATYAMAAEALDIKTLSTLVMATPKTDIEQSVGRILRVKHASPIVVDIIDSHDLFKNQWKSRKTFYRKCGYKILYTNSTKYKGFLYDGVNIDWSTDKDWKIEFEPKSKDEKKEYQPKESTGKCSIDLPLEFIEE